MRFKEFGRGSLALQPQRSAHLDQAVWLQAASKDTTARKVTFSLQLFGLKYLEIMTHAVSSTV